MSTDTTNKGYVKQTAGENVGTWGTGGLNGNFDIMDKNLGGTLSLSGLTNSDVTLSSSQAQNCFYILTGTLSGNINIIWPQVGGFYFVDNQTTGSFTVTLKTSAVGGDTVTATQGNQTLIFTDGTDVKASFTGPSGDFTVPGTLTAATVKATSAYKKGSTTLVLGHGQCQFQYSSTTACKLMPYNGNTLAFPDGSVIQIPSTGISLSNGGLSNSTVYYVYAVNDGTLEASITGHATDTTTGIEVKSGNTTRVLVGMVYLVGGVFLDSGANRLVASWFNRAQKQGSANFSTTRSVTSVYPTFAEINSELRVSVLTWGTAINRSFSGYEVNVGTNQVVYTAVMMDNTSTLGPVSGNFDADNGPNVFACNDVVSPSEGFHFMSAVGAVSASSATFQTTNQLSVSLSI